MTIIERLRVNKENNQDNARYNPVMHICILSVLFCLSHCLNQSSPLTPELISLLTNIKNESIHSHEIWNTFFIDEYGLIETINSTKLKTKCIHNNYNKNDESMCVTSAKTNTIHDEIFFEEELKLRVPGYIGISPFGLDVFGNALYSNSQRTHIQNMNDFYDVPYV